MPEDAKNPIPGYELLSKLGEGGMGAVYKARQVSLDRTVAVKILSPRLAKSPGYTDRFMREAKIAGKLNHVNIVNAIDVGQTDKYFYMVMEYVEGKTLRQVVKERGTLDEEYALHVTMQVARGLAWAHRHGIIHRDVKPDNIMIDIEGIAKLCDLGLAKHEDAEAAMLTQSGMMVGTPHYVSPEQARGEKDIDGRTDIYSLGATLYHAVTGKPPFGGTSAAVVMTKHLTEQVPWPSEVNPALSENLSMLVQKMMAKDRDDRYGTTDDLVRDMEFVIDGKAPDSEMVDAHKSSVAGVPGAVGAGAPRMSEARRRIQPKKKPVGLIVGIAAGVVAVVLAIVFMSRSGEEPPPAQPQPGGQTVVTPTDPKPDPDQPKGKAEEMFEYAANWEKEHPEDYDDAISRYQHVVKYAAGTVWEMKARDAIETLVGKRDEAAGKEFAKLVAGADKLAEAGDYDGAIGTYANLPAKFEKLLKAEADGAVAALKKTAGERIGAVMKAAENLSADGEPDKGIDELDKVKDIKYAALSGPLAELRSRLGQEKENVAELARKKAEAAAREKLDAAWAAFDEKVMAGDIAGAKAALESARADEALKPMAETTEKWGSVLKGFEEAAQAEKKAAESLTSLVGKDVVLETAKGKRKGKVKSVGDGVIVLEHRFSINKQVGYAEIRVNTEELTEEEKARLMPPADPATPDGWLAKAAAAMGAQDVAAAEAALAKAGDHPLAAHYREKLDVIRLGAVEVTAKKAWEKNVAPFLAQEKLDKKNAEEARKALGEFRTAHGETKFAGTVAGKATGLEGKIGAALGGIVTLEKVQALFEGKVVSFDPITYQIELSYDFSNALQIKDWDNTELGSSVFWSVHKAEHKFPKLRIWSERLITTTAGVNGLHLKAPLEGRVEFSYDFFLRNEQGRHGAGLVAGDTPRRRVRIYIMPAYGGKGLSLEYTTDAAGSEPVRKKTEMKPPYRAHHVFDLPKMEFRLGDGLKVTSEIALPQSCRDRQHPCLTVSHSGFNDQFDNVTVKGRLQRAWLESMVKDAAPTTPAAGPEGVTLENVRELFKGRVLKFDPATLEVVVSYNFQDPAQFEDWRPDSYPWRVHGGTLCGPDELTEGYTRPDIWWGARLDPEHQSIEYSAKGTRWLCCILSGDGITSRSSTGYSGLVAGDGWSGLIKGTAFQNKDPVNPLKADKLKLPEIRTRFVRFRFTRDGARMTFSIDGKETMTTDKATDRCGGHIGLWMYNQHPSIYDNVVVGGRLDREWLESALKASAGAGAGSDAIGYTAVWAKKNAKGTAPGAENRFDRFGGGPGAMYDSKRKLCILFGGGMHGQAVLNDIWGYDTARHAWTCIEPLDKNADDKSKPKGWGGATGAPIVYDPDGDLYWLASGTTKDRADGWYMWTYDPEKRIYAKTMKILGTDFRFAEGGVGTCAIGYSSRLKSLVSPWEVIDLRTKQKRRMEPLSTLQLRGNLYSHASSNGLGTAGADGMFILFGAVLDKEDRKSPGETWQLDPGRGTWTRLQPKTSPPGTRRRSMVYHKELNVWVMFAGGLPGSRANDLWVYAPHLNDWLPMDAKGPRGWGAMWYDEANNVVVFFSEEHGATYTLKLTARK